MRKYLIVVWLAGYSLALPNLCMAQLGSDFDFEDFIENLFSLQEADLDYSNFYESLLLLYQHPIDINTASHEELKSTFVLSGQQIDSLHSYIGEKGKLVTLYELQIIEGFDYATIRNLLPFITINPKDATTDSRPLIQRILSEKNHNLISRYEGILESKRGYQPAVTPDQNVYLGSPAKVYLRYRVSKPGDFSFGFTSEKDPGEPFNWNKLNKRFGMDFWSAHAMLEHKGRWQKIIIGDYQLQLGQGLILGSGFSVGKGSETINSVQRVSTGIRPYSSVLESGFLRGLAATYNLKKTVSVTGFLSRQNLDANVLQHENSQNKYISSIQSSGLHRTGTEIERKHTIRERVYGLNVNFKPNYLLGMGATFLISRFNTPIELNDLPYKRFEFQGATNFNGGLYANYQWQGFSFFAEGAFSKSGGLGAIAGLTKNLTSRLELALIIRDYDSNFHTLRGSAFGENGRNINEQGVYWGIKYTLNRKFFLTAYYDSYSFPWLKFRVNAPSRGHDYLIRLNYNPGNRVIIYAQARAETKEVNSTSLETGHTIVMPGTKHQYVINIEFDATPEFRLKSKVQWSNYVLNHEKTRGLTFIQDASYKLPNWRFSGRIAFFDTNGPENRQYVYERDVLYAFSIPAYSGRGVRNYLLVQYQVGRKIDLWARISRTTFYDRNKIGTGLETIEGDKRTEVKFQMRYKFN